MPSAGLHALVETAADDLELVFAAQLGEVHGVARHADRQQTQFGIILLKSLFSEAMQTDSGEEVSSYEIKNILQQCIDEEDKRKPLTDETLMDILNTKGYHIARRTVAKYREMLGIPVARLRKQI